MSGHPGAHGRVFLAGDAAHAHSPMGDRGMTADRLLRYVVDTGWFFDTELLVLAER